jgi:hypothetical protein
VIYRSMRDSTRTARGVQKVQKVESQQEKVPGSGTGWGGLSAVLSSSYRLSRSAVYEFQWAGGSFFENTGIFILFSRSL